MARTAIHPGEHLAEELKVLGLSAAALSRDIDVPVNRITSIINGQRAITADTALRLGRWFKTSPEFWLNLQKLYELRIAREHAGADIEKLPSLGPILRERSARHDVPPYVHTMATKKMHAVTGMKASHRPVFKRAKQTSRKRAR